MAEHDQFVTLGAADEVFAIPVCQVQEILDLRPIARLPHTPSSFLGLTDVRGHSVPVVDLRSLLGLMPTEPSLGTRILVLELDLAGRRLRIGLLVDRVFEVTGLDAAQAEPAPDIGRRWQSDCIRGIGRRAGGFVVILDMPRLMGADEGAAMLLDDTALAA
ncbi:chemotaxis protein CheW [Roseomonas stagni]|uniref:Chemotaxis protein CheW n=1 Tax=Falsiroseomonas algicola TaxID=2716930 RepID=A0A6M1LK76_9PROT|nr:chemotaxis protein CheW [Falsiroseomonas algicola]NGM20720.1 chemotaxis protein CheW [Falsiroseomonas algicola]